MTYFVRRFKPKLLVFITTGTFNLLSKILTTLRLSGAVWIEARNHFRVSSNLCADFYSDSLSRHRFVVVSAFPSLPFLYLSVNSFVFTLLSSRSSSLIAVATRKVKSQRTDKAGFREIATAQNLKDQPAFRPSQYWLARPK